jgi:hypothetical protein
VDQARPHARCPFGAAAIAVPVVVWDITPAGLEVVPQPSAWAGAAGEAWPITVSKVAPTAVTGVAVAAWSATTVAGVPPNGVLVAMPFEEPGAWPTPLLPMVMAARRRRPRMTIASVMVLIALLSLLILVTAPLFRLGPPPCLTPVPTARWLVARPGIAHCTDCHGGPRVSLGMADHRDLRLTFLPPANPGGPVLSPGPDAGGITRSWY